ncbi:hypothetical protein CHU98_g2693 [Xylaria longipes]|nr:hypothetical protein CHU98_g2693 [Xylaria longipes]
MSILMDSLTTFQLHASGCRWEPNDARWRGVWEMAQLELLSRYSGHTVPRQQSGLRELLDRRWFRRVWILQEVASARKALLYCGRDFVSVPIFTMSPGLLGVGLNSHHMAVLKVMPTYSGGALPKTRDEDLWQLLIDFRQSEASEPHDKIFALLGLCADQDVWEVIVPDYTQTESALARATITYIITKGVGPPPEWIASVDVPSIYKFLNQLAFNPSPQMSMYMERIFIHIKSYWDAEAVRNFLVGAWARLRVTRELVDAATLNMADASEMLSLLLQQDMERLGRVPSWKPSPVYIQLVGKLKIMIEMSTHFHEEAAMSVRRKELYHLLSLVQGDHIHDKAIYWSRYDTTRREYLKSLEWGLSDVPFSTSHQKARNFEERAFFAIAIIYGKLQKIEARRQIKAALFDTCPISNAATLYTAVYYNDKVALQHLLDKGTKILIGQLPNSLSLAVHRGHFEGRAVMKILRAYPASIVGYDGRIPLNCAAELETITVIRFLLELGANPDAIDIDGRTAIQVARDSGRFDVVLFLEAVKGGVSYEDAELSAHHAEVKAALDSI